MDHYMKLRVETAPYVAAYEHPEDIYEEFVHEVSVTLYYNEDDEDEYDDEPERAETIVAELEAIIVRCGRVYDADVLSMADAHSSSAEGVVGFLQEVDDNDFYARFDVVSQQANTLVVMDLRWLHGTTTAEIRQFVRRAVDQFDVDLVIFEREDEFSKHFEGFFEPDGLDRGYLIYSKAHIWPDKVTPEIPPDIPKAQA